MHFRKAVPGDEKGIAKVHIDSWRSTYKGIVEDDYLEQLRYEDREKMWQQILQQKHDQVAVFVALNEKDEIVGFTSGGPERSKEKEDRGELYAIYLLERYQRQGIGIKLLNLLTDFLKENGMEECLVWVLQENPSKNFYQSLGAELYKEMSIDIGGKQYTEEAYIWTKGSAL